MICPSCLDIIKCIKTHRSVSQRPQDFDCTYPTGDPSGDTEGSQSSVSCPAGYEIIYCGFTSHGDRVGEQNADKAARAKPG